MQLAGLSSGAAPPDMFKFIVNTPFDGGLEFVNYPGVMSSAFGHNAGQNTISVGAVAFSNAPAFSTETPVESAAAAETVDSTDKPATTPAAPS